MTDCIASHVEFYHSVTVSLLSVVMITALVQQVRITSDLFMNNFTEVLPVIAVCFLQS